MKFRTKILLAIWGVVLMLFLISSVIIKYWMEVQVKVRFAEDLRSNRTTVRELSSLRSGEIIKSCEILAETPRLKAVVEIGDANTAAQLARELNRNVLGDLFLLKGAHERMLAGQIDDKPIASQESLIVNRFKTELEGRSSLIACVIRGAAYRCVTTPILVGADLVGTLTLGYRTEKDDLDAIKAMTNSEVAIALGDTISISTLGDEAHRALSSWLLSPENTRRFPLNMPGGSDTAAITSLKTSQDTYLASSLLLTTAASSGQPSIYFILLKPVEREVQAALKPVFNSFLVLSIIVLLVTAVIGYVISQGITRPIAALVRGTTEISNGNYDHAIVVGSDAELRYLAEKFTEMSRSLKEKMHQLAERNIKLELALQQLQEMQVELVRTERLAATGKLTAQLSHEINNPAHNIQSCLQTLRKRLATRNSNPQDTELLDVALEEVARMTRLTRQMLDVYRTSMVPLERVPVCLNDIIKEVASASMEALREQHIDTRLSLLSSLPSIQGSQDKLKQVFLNLFLNAKDAMPEGGTLSVHSMKENGNIVVQVVDTGIGIPAENANRIFDAFFTTKDKLSGVGLGLSVTYGIVRQHDGTIAVRSNVGKGSTFTLTFPIVRTS